MSCVQLHEVCLNQAQPLKDEGKETQKWNNPSSESPSNSRKALEQKVITGERDAGFAERKTRVDL